VHNCFCISDKTMPTFTSYFTNNLFLVTQQSVGREPLLCNEMLMRVMQEAFVWTRERIQFERIGYVFLPDQMIILLSPTGHVGLDRIMQQIRQRFQLEYHELLNMTENTLLWEEDHNTHRVRDVEELAKYLDYIHTRPVQREFVNSPGDWPYSSFTLWQQRGIYPPQWGAQ